jgi:signal transduction histidine kinase
MHGFNAFYPQHIKENPYPPQIVITDFQIFNRSVPIGVRVDGRSILEKSITETREITLSYKDAVFSFEFAALDYAIPEKNQYAYMMEGFDKEWNEVGTRRVATYTNLPAGDYVFRVKGSNNDGVWNNEGIAVMLTIVPPFWETAWFRSLVIACVLGAGYAVYALRIWRLKKAQQRLEYEVRERTKELVEKNRQIKQQQHQLIESEKMAALGQLVAGIAHEINTPLGAIRASIGNISDALSETFQHLPHLLQQLSPTQQRGFFTLIDQALQNKKPLTSREERQLRRAMTKDLETYNIDRADEIADMLVDMGIDNILPFLPLFQQENAIFMLQVAHNITTQHHNSDNITMAVDRASKIVFALKSYAHYDDSSKMIPANITESIDVVLTLYHNQLKQGITIVKHYEDVPAIPCFPDELHQVWTNLIHNAIQAMNGQGTLEIAVFNPPVEKGESSHLVVQITDSGCGIPSEIQPRIFEPFFTTKSAGEGSGLGLNIVRKIIDRHQGSIQVESQPGKTTFKVLLPIISSSGT